MNEEAYTIKEFAKKTGLTQEYIRQACRDYIDTKGSKAKLPTGYKAKKIYDTWIIEPQKSFYDSMPFPIERLSLNQESEYIDLIVINDKRINEPIFLLNLFDFYGPLKKSPLFYDITADYILYLVYKLLLQKLQKESNKYNYHKVNQRTKTLFVDNLGLLIFWLQESGRSLYFNKHLEHTCKLQHCLTCGERIDRNQKNKYLFCNEEHYSNFYKRKNSIFRLLLDIQPLQVLDMTFVLQENFNRETLYSQIDNLNIPLFQVTNRMISIITGKRKSKAMEIIYENSLFETFNKAVSNSINKITDEMEPFTAKSPKEREALIKEVIDEHILKKLKLHQRKALIQSPLYTQFLIKLHRTSG